MVRSKKLALMILFLFLLSPIHEIGHLVIAQLDGAQINHWSILPRIANGKFMGGYVNVNEFTFSSKFTLTLFTLAGFIFTFFPSLIIFLYMKIRQSEFWFIPYGWLMISSVVAGYDFQHIGIIHSNQLLGNALFISSYLLTAIFMGYFFSLIILKKF